MKRLTCLPFILAIVLIFSSCRNKTVVLLTKKWDCVQVENMVLPGAKFQSPEDSANAVQLKSMVQSISWTFKNNMGYECSMYDRVVSQGKYELLENDKIIILKPETNGTINRYLINNLTENEMVLSSRTEAAKLVLHFKPN